MVAILPRVAFALSLLMAIMAHVIGFFGRDWVAAKLDYRDIANIASASGMGPEVPKEASDGAGMDISMGLWRFCIRIDLLNFEYGRVAGMAGASDLTDLCETAKSEDLPGWWKAVQALGILSLITAVADVAIVIYSFIRDSKGDRARLLPHFMAAICLLAGVLLLIAVVVYGAEFTKAMDKQLKDLVMMDPTIRPLTENLKQHISLGYSFALEASAGVMMVLASLLLALPRFRNGPDPPALIGGTPNLAA